MRKGTLVQIPCCGRDPLRGKAVGATNYGTIQGELLGASPWPGGKNGRYEVDLPGYQR
jgi:hypothetical protein